VAACRPVFGRNLMLSQFVGFEGRIGRGAWWLGHLLAIVLLMFAFGILVLTNNPTANIGGKILVSLLSLACSIASMVFSICATVKRYHDRNKSGWWFWLCLLPIISFWQFIECGFCSGDDGDNNYGPPPGSAARAASLDREVSAMSTASSSRLSKLDDDYLKNYARETAMNQATQQLAPAASFAATGPSRPVFGKR
jgi:uncharacterized membrane protein YhaH (DUF805 family)